MAMAGDAPLLPEEIVRNILIRLPVKSIIRFRCVCKRWRNIIKTPLFISDQLHHSTRQTPSLLFERNGLLWHLDCQMQLHKVDNALFMDFWISFEIVGSSNGLLCVDVSYGQNTSSSLLLWNPATGEVRKLSPNMKGCMGFGFSPIVNDYKIVITYSSGIVFRKIDRVLVYSLNSGSWKEVEYGINNVVPSPESVTVNGNMFWFGSERKQGRYFYDSIVSFDIANEVFTLIPFTLIPMPSWDTSRFRFTVYENKLSVLSVSVIQNSQYLIELWVMEDCIHTSWAKKYSSRPIPCFVDPVTIWMNQIVCEGVRCRKWDDDEQKIALLNISTDELKTFDISKCGGDYDQDFIVHYAESLVPIGGKKLCSIFV